MKRLLLLLTFIYSLSLFPQWTQTNGPNGGEAFEIVQVDSYLLLSTGTGIYKSNNRGKSWILSTNGLPCNEIIYELVEHNNFLYASISRNGIYYSSDAGNNWTPINNGIENLTFYSLLVEGDNIYAGYANGGVYYSPNNGVNWYNKSNGIANFQIQDFLFFNSKIYAASKFLFETSDNGETWTKIDIPNLNPNGIRSMTKQDNTFYASSEGSIHISADNLVSWSTKNINNNNASIVSMHSFNDVVYATTSFGRYFYSNDNGINWNLIQNSNFPLNTNGFVNHLFFTNNSILMSTSYGLFKSIDDGFTWTTINDGIKGLLIKTLEKNSSYIFAGTSRNGFFRSSDNGENWVAKNNGLDDYNSLIINDIITFNDLTIITTGSGLYKSNNNGDSWTRKLDPGLNKSTQGLGYDNGVLVTGINDSGIYISKDNGDTWNLTSVNGLNTQTGYKSIKVYNNTILVGTTNGEIFISTNLGNSWTYIPVESDVSIVNDIIFSNNILLVATNKGLITSPDLGSTWTYFSNNQKNILDVVFYDNKICIATNSGAYISTTDEKVWYPLCDGIEKKYITKLLIKENILFAGTNGVWKRNLIVGDFPPEDSSSLNIIKKINLCSNNNLINLYDEIGISSNVNGTWSPNLVSTNGIYNPKIDPLGTYTFTYENNPCGCEKQLKIEIKLDEQANAGIDTNLVLCKSSEPVNLLKKIDGNPDSNGIWSPQLASGTNIFDPKIDSAGIYTYTVENQNCKSSSELYIELTERSDKIINYKIDVVTSQNSNSITITTENNLLFVYSLDGITYQTKNTFNNLSPGNYTVFGKEINGCSLFQRDVYIFGYPIFFTPNSDGENDIWKILGEPKENYILHIFNRYGKLLKTLNNIDNYWDGTYNNKLLPSDTYWFKITLKNSKIVKGYFALIK